MEIRQDGSKGLMHLLAVTVDCALNRFENLNGHEVVSHLGADRWCRHRMLKVCLPQSAIGGAPFEHGLATASGNPSNHLVTDFQFSVWQDGHQVRKPWRDGGPDDEGGG